MAALENLGIETHPNGTTGLNGIINGNWQLIDQKLGRLQGSRVSAYGATVNLNFSQAEFQRVALLGNVTFTASDIQAGSRITLVIEAGAGPRNLTFPAFTFLGSAAPTSIAANKIGLLELFSSGETVAGILARYTESL